MKKNIKVEKLDPIPLKKGGMRVIFLELDNLLAESRWRDPIAPTWFDKRSVAALNHIVMETGAVIVISSPWRQWNSLPSLANLLKMQGINAKVVGSTETCPPGKKHIVILEWLKRFRDRVESYVIVDHDPSAGKHPHEGRVVEIEGDMRLQVYWIPRAIQILRSGQPFSERQAKKQI